MLREQLFGLVCRCGGHNPNLFYNFFYFKEIEIKLRRSVGASSRVLGSSTHRQLLLRKKHHGRAWHPISSGQRQFVVYVTRANKKKK